MLWFKLILSNVTYFTHHCRNWGRMSLRGWTHKRHPIPHPNGRAIGCLLWIDRVIMAPHFIGGPWDLFYYHSLFFKSMDKLNYDWPSVVIQSIYSKFSIYTPLWRILSKRKKKWKSHLQECLILSRVQFVLKKFWTWQRWDLISTFFWHKQTSMWPQVQKKKLANDVMRTKQDVIQFPNFLKFFFQISWVIVIMKNDI